ncbi:MAG: ABC transporter permease [Cyclobacteriaceae bacterium]
MLRNLFIVTLRNLKRQKFFAVLNTLGLSLGIGSCLIIGLYVHHELTYDQFHEKIDRIYRINQTFIWGDDDALFGSTGPAVRGAIEREVPEFETLTRVHPTGDLLVSNMKDGELIVFEETKILAVDENFFEVFSFPLTRGNNQKALVNPNGIVITEETALKYFETTDVVGRQLEIGEADNRKNYQITGVAKNVPLNSHIEFDFLLSMTSFPNVKKRDDSWMWTTFVTFGTIREDANVEEVAQKVAAVPGKYLEAFLQKYRGISYEEFLASGEEWDLYIQPMSDIHLRSTHVYSRLNQVGDITNIYILMIIGGLILGLSLINYINLATARSTTRAKEVGIRKVIGSGKYQLMGQFLAESMVYVFIAAIISFFLVEFVLPVINQATEQSLSIAPLFSPVVLLVIVFGLVLVGLCSGLYPAFYLSAFRPSQVLKGNLTNGLKNGGTRNALVTVQFIISITMITCTLVMQDQVTHWRQIDLGFEKENKLIIKNAQRLGTSTEAFKQEILADARVKGVTITSDTPPIVFDFDNFNKKGEEDKSLNVNYLTADEEFLDIYGLQLIQGRNFDNGRNEKSNIIVNEYLTKAFGFDNPVDAINERIGYGGDTEFEIIGIIKDFNSSLSHTKYPFAVFPHNAPIFRNTETSLTLNLHENMSPKEVKSLITSVNATWNSLNAKAPFDYTFADQDYLQFFDQTIKMGEILNGLAILAVFIACLGLIGLITFVIEKRNKEIGIRKVLGASVAHIWILLSGSFGKLLVLGFLIAAPLSWYLMNEWLQNFELRISISLITIGAAGFIMLVMAVATISVQTIKATMINPVDYLKDE